MHQSRIRRTAARIDRAIARVDVPLVGVCLLAAVLLNVALVVGRYLFNYSANSVEELSVYAVIWMVFLGTVLADRRGSHINVDLLYHFVSAVARRRLRRIADALQALVCLGLAALTMKTVVFTWRIGEVSLSTLQAPVWLLMSVMPLCFLVLALRSFARTFGILEDVEHREGDAHL